MYGTLCRRHLEGAPFGVIRLDRLRPSDIEALILALRGRGLSPSSVRQIYTVARAGLDAAVRDGLLGRNPVALVKRPGVQRGEARHPSGAEVAAVLRAAAGSRYYLALVIVAGTGLRKGELLALRWSDVDLDAGTLTVRGTLARINGQLKISEPKTARSRRTVPVAPAVVTMLKTHRKTQLAERLRAGNQWTDTGLVICTEFGTPVDPRSFLRVIETAAKAAGVGGVGIHTLRHTAATRWLESGVHVKQVADLLGHSSIAVTADVYGHGSDDGARRAVESLIGTLGL